MLRKIFVLVACTMTTNSLSAIGRFFGQRDHTTVMAQRDSAKRLIKDHDPIFLSYWHKYVLESEIYAGGKRNYL